MENVINIIIDSIDFRTLALLLALMLVVAGFRQSGVFERLVEMILGRLKSLRAIVGMLVMLCFFTSMVVTNDVALITFVPFGIMVLNKVGRKDLLIPVLVFETIAANLGSMATPLGNPQNLYIYSISGMGFFELVIKMLPYVAASFVGVLICLIFIPREKVDIEIGDKTKIDVLRSLAYLAAFAVCLLCVFHVIEYYSMLGAVLVVIAICDYKLLKKADYKLLLTFIVLFVLIGFLKNIDAVKNVLAGIIAGNEVLVGVATSQVISNVPAAVLLSGFTSDYTSLLAGVNIGGLGTLIASMASLITFRFYKKENADGSSMKYVSYFTVANLIFMAALLILWVVIK